jgi:hypothetical protein
MTRDQDASRPLETSIAGCPIDAIEFYGGLVYLGAGVKPNRIRLQMSGEFTLTEPHGEAITLNTESSWPTMAKLLSLQYLPIEAVAIDERAVLRLRVGGWSVEVGPDLESWTLTGPGSEFRAAYSPTPKAPFPKRPPEEIPPS